jgi:hypothetical protein
MACFSVKTDPDPTGYPSAYSDDWLVWTHEVHGMLAKLGKSTIRDSIERGLDTVLLGTGDDTFQGAKDSILNGYGRLRGFLARLFRHQIERCHLGIIRQNKLKPWRRSMNS